MVSAFSPRLRLSDGNSLPLFTEHLPMPPNVARTPLLFMDINYSDVPFLLDGRAGFIPGRDKWFGPVQAWQVFSDGRDNWYSGPCPGE